MVKSESTLRSDLKQCGIGWDRTIQKAIDQSSEADIQREIACLQEQQALRSIKPHGFLVEALRDPAWQPCDLAQPPGLVIAALQDHGVQCVILLDQKQVPFADLLEKYPLNKLEEMREIVSSSGSLWFQQRSVLRFSVFQS
ncbi:hypothetical protein ACQ4M3_07625 [Leptolyngbya sp. AN03gr2]|uniref:hypothetical protein n=1 Tax=unclassified Leptolyngbya TaxID=2650499 RepID=UPI003D30EF57